MMKENVNITYNIKMQTPIGVRIGKMIACRKKQKLIGYLDILKHKEPFTGEMSKDNGCIIDGYLMTLMKTISYTATGTISDESLELEVFCGKNKFHITGTPEK
ncbi:MAG: hypothetical protein ACI4IE_08755 [Eubacterium sp.]